MDTKLTPERKGPSTLDIPGLTSSSISPDGYIASRDIGAKLVIVMVGLPARGKSYIVKKLARYLNWLQHETRIFNVGDRRRTLTAETNPLIVPPSSSSSTSPAAFFDPTSPSLVNFRDQIALATLDSLLDWLMHRGGTIGILDATNISQRRRQLVLSHIKQRPGPEPSILFLESCCFDQDLLRRNILLKLSGPDYKHRNPEKALADFCQRVSNYEKLYVPLGIAEEEQGIPYVQMIDVGRKMNTHKIRGYLATHVVEYLLNFNLSERQIWISCNGESLDDAAGKIGRTSCLTGKGRQYARALSEFIQEQRDKWSAKHLPQARLSNTNNGMLNLTNFRIWTSMMPQAIETVLPFPDDLYEKKEMKMLDDLNVGNMAGLTFEEIQTLHPTVFDSHSRNKLLHRWPGVGGEGYVDVINRLRPVIIELERMTDHLLLVTHKAVVRVLLAYFLGLQRHELAKLDVAKNSVFCLEPVCLPMLF
ncbi:bifunctional 6-phosphofructo-2-kinase/fructose-2-6-bisphosphate 2-phosphatase [Penicillium canescens]|nr:bifunctional 6-phosphofructo-2-kinase/fructose-2-6-bisphosphate 2-phosphatase [Penicillium canescens]